MSKRLTPKQREKPKTRASRWPKAYMHAQIMKVLRRLEAKGRIYSALDAKGQLRWYAAEFSPTGGPKLSTGSDKLN